MPITDRIDEFHQVKKVGNRNVVITAEETKIVYQKDDIRFIETFLDKVEEIYDRFSGIEGDVHEILFMQSSYLEYNTEDKRLSKVYDKIRKSLIAVSRKIADLEEFFNEKKKFKSNTEIRICATQLLTLKRKLSECMSNYYHIQEDYKLHCKARVKRQAEIVGANTSDTDFDEAVQNRTEIFLKAVLPEIDISQQILVDVRKRHKEFLDLEKNIRRLHELFFEIAVIVQKDCVLIDRIDMCDSIVMKTVEQGNVELEQTNLITKKERKTSTIFCIAVTSVIVVILLVIIIAFKIW